MNAMNEITEQISFTQVAQLITILLFSSRGMYREEWLDDKSV